jgi:hypothetical protein
MINKFCKEYYFFLLILVVAIFTSVYIFSLFKIINVWTYTESHINYSEGLVRRGLFGTIMIASNKYLHIPIKYFFSSFFYLFTLINIFIFFTLIKQYSKNFIIFTFLALNPALILFSFYDLGGYARFEIVTITSVLIHAYFIQKLNQGFLTEKKYIEKLQFIILPLIIIFIFISDTMLLLIPYHIFLSLNVLRKNNKLNNKIYLYLLLLIPVYLIVDNPITPDLGRTMFNKLNNKYDLDFWIIEAISNNNIISRIQIEGGHMFTLKNNIIYLSIFLIFLLPIVAFFNYLNLKKNINIRNNFFIILAIAPIFLLFPIARDWGRWVHLIIITIFSYYSQFVLKKDLNTIIKNNLKISLTTFIIVLFLFFYSFFIRIPHCCNLEKLNLTIYGGGIEKIKVLYDVIFVKKIDIDQRFRNF